MRLTEVNHEVELTRLKGGADEDVLRHALQSGGVLMLQGQPFATLHKQTHDAILKLVNENEEEDGFSFELNGIDFNELYYHAATKAVYARVVAYGEMHDYSGRDNHDAIEWLWLKYFKRCVAIDRAKNTSSGKTWSVTPPRSDDDIDLLKALPDGFLEKWK